MDTPMMTTARKSLLVSLSFHALMGSVAFFLLVKMHTPPPMVKIPLQHMMIVSLSHSEPTVQQPKISEPIPVVTPQQPTKKPTVTQPIIIPMKPVVSTVQTVATPIPLSSTPPVVQHTVQTISTPIVTASKPKIDVASEKQAFFNTLRANIQNQLRYPTAARRRGMEGEIEVRFTLLSNGEINGISIRRGEGIFHNAAIAAVNAASGISIPKTLSDTMPLEIDLTLEFKLKS
jgi:periplasmic protein TonB